MRKLLIAVPLLLIGLFVGADLGMRALAENRVSTELQSTFGLQQRPSVSLGGFPFLPKLMSGSFPAVSIGAPGGVERKGTAAMPFERVDVALRDVSFSASRLIFGDRTTIRAAHGDGTATLSQGGLNQVLHEQAPLTASLSAGHVTIRPDGLDASVTATVSIKDGKLVVDPAIKGLPSVEIALPELVDGMTYTQVRIDGSTATLSFTLEGVTFQVA